MLQRIREARENESGFTLIELLIVIVVLGILAGIVVFGVSTFRNDAKAEACASTIKTVSVAADAFDAKTGGYPTAITQLLPTATAPGYIKTDPTAGANATISGPTFTAGTRTFTATCV